MRKSLIVLAIVLILGIAIAYAQGPGMMGGQYGGYWVCDKKVGGLT